MRPGGRLAAAIEVLEDIERRHRPAADALKDWGLSHRFAGSGDRAAIGNIVYDALRRRRSAGWMLDGDDARAIALGALLLEAGMTPEALDATLAGDRFAPETLSDAERAAFLSRDLAEAPPAIAADVPDWCVPLMERMFGEEWPQEGRGLARRPPLDMRVNTLLATRGQVLAELHGTGAAPCHLASEGLRIAPIAGAGRHPNVQAEPAFQKGWFEIQDEGSQLAALLAGAVAGEQVLDYCAGAGGKTLALAAAMENTGQIVAHDSEKQRLAPIFDRLRRAGTRNVQVQASAQGLNDLAGRMDLVLIDAPCTGSGTWRRRPDAKWRLSPRQLEVRQREQADILAAAARFVRPGGRLAYVTCSVFAEENGAQVEAFRAAHPEFRPVDHMARWHERVPKGADAVRIDSTGGLCLTPARSGTDGFYFCLLERAE